MACHYKSLLILVFCAAGIASDEGAIAGEWGSLDASQRSMLAPLEENWADMSEVERQHWMGIIDGASSLTREEQTRLANRMREWAAMSPEARERARDQYRALRSMPPDQRERLYQQWQMYQSLPPEQRRTTN